MDTLLLPVCSRSVTVSHRISATASLETPSPKMMLKRVGYLSESMSVRGAIASEATRAAAIFIPCR